LFVLYADRKLLTPATIACIKAQFHLPAERTEIQSDSHYQSNETPHVLVEQRDQTKKTDQRFNSPEPNIEAISTSVI
jgi:hypothetical protein